MIKLYKRIDGVLRYHEAWTDEDSIVEHWGIVGERGQTREHPKPARKSEEAMLSDVLKSAIESGYEPVDDLKIVLVEYPVKGMGTGTDLTKRHALEDHLSETLGWTGLGHCDGGSMGSGSMEACCMVVDVEIATRVLAEDLKRTEFADYSRIYEE